MAAHYRTCPFCEATCGLEIDGRKHHAACALFDSAGRLLCASQALWIELKEE